MLIDGLPADGLFRAPDASSRAIAMLLSFFTRTLGLTIVRDIRDEPGGGKLGEALALGRLLMQHRIIERMGQSERFPDEPRLHSWYTLCATQAQQYTGGTTWDSESDAIYAALAEALERYIWNTRHDYFQKTFVGTVADVARKGTVINPKTVSGFSADQRAAYPLRTLADDASYTWIRGTSHVHNAPVWIPAQIVSGYWSNHAGTSEPTIRQTTTNGLATWHTKVGALLGGMNEIIEREAYMITWLNQLTPPRIALATLAATNPSLASSIATCERYGLRVHALHLPTDAPTHAIMVLMEDRRGRPQFSVGLKAHRSLPYAIQKAMTEALRARQGYRTWERAGNVWDTSTQVQSIGHRERMYYWGVPENARGLEFLIQGSEADASPRAWDECSDDEHFRMIADWCRANQFECASVSLGTSRSNPTKLHVEMVVMPDLQPTYLAERDRAFGASRLRDVPHMLGYKARTQPFEDAPHPFS